MRAALVGALAALVAVVGVAGCGDDDDGGPEEAYCAAADALRADVSALTDLDVVAEGTNALEDRFDAIRSDLDDLRESGREVAADEIDALDAAVDDLQSAIDALGGELSVDNASVVLDAIGDVGPAAQAVYSRLSEACP